MKSFIAIPIMVVSMITAVNFNHHLRLDANSKSKVVRDEKGFFYLYIPPVYGNGVAYISQMLYFPGVASCNVEQYLDYQRKAESDFEKHLRANYTENFTYSAINNIRILDAGGQNEYKLFDGRQTAIDKLYEYIVNQKSENYKVVNTSFTYNCE
ncbi:hypothetical protein [Hymenobacter amundsenii]|uniref:hypothetical protein n=1 Tax=Hymenobacter amundsenii TaxID=2006685 RepID=UPI000F81EA4B|nr:hypothetical protein [Hymenobacter amundsenii]